MSVINTRLCLLLLCLSLLFPLNGRAEPKQVVYYWPSSTPEDTRGHYPLALLQLAIQKSASDYQLIPSGELMSQYRTLRELGSANGPDVVWTMTSREREENYLPIRIPIDRGLIGWRLLIIHRDHKENYLAISEKELKAKLAVQGNDWPDYVILKENHLRVFSASNFDAMFKMVESKRVDYFSRSVTEIWPELEQKKQMPLVAAPKWALYYPTALYYFVNKENKKLAKAIEQGLLRAIEDGSMKRLFLHHHGRALELANLKSRTVIQLTNPILPAETPLKNKALWFDPQLGY
jgi:Bacterial extracellular solute-binding proteins, family 3